MYISAVLVLVLIVVYRVWSEDCRRMSEVAPNLFVSNWVSSVDETLLNRRRITRIICINQDGKLPEHERMYKRLGINHYHFYLHDLPDAPIGLILNRTFTLINEEIERGGRVLVHCRAGISRSVTVAAAYMMRKNRMTATQAIEQIRVVRPVAWPNHGFRRTLSLL